MKTAVTLGRPILVETPVGAAWADARGRLAAYVALTKPRLTVMALVTVATGFVLGRAGRRIRRRCS